MRHNAANARQIWGTLNGSELDRFWSKVDQRGPDECWPWKAGRFGNGYGEFNLRGKDVGAHRVAFALQHCRAPAKKQICHTCDNPPCCNPAHLFAGDDLANRRDAIAKGRHQHGETNGNARLTEAKILLIRADTRKPLLIAEDHGVAEATIYDVIKRRTWKHLN